VPGSGSLTVARTRAGEVANRIGREFNRIRFERPPRTETESSFVPNTETELVVNQEGEITGFVQTEGEVETEAETEGDTETARGESETETRERVVATETGTETETETTTETETETESESETETESEAVGRNTIRTQPWTTGQTGTGTDPIVFGPTDQSPRQAFEEPTAGQTDQQTGTPVQQFGQPFAGTDVTTESAVTGATAGQAIEPEIGEGAGLDGIQRRLAGFESDVSDTQSPRSELGTELDTELSQPLDFLPEFETEFEPELETETETETETESEFELELETETENEIEQELELETETAQELEAEFGGIDLPGASDDLFGFGGGAAETITTDFIDPLTGQVIETDSE